MRDGRDLLERHHHVGAGHRDRQVLDVATHRRGLRDAGAPRRRAIRRSGSTQSPTSTPANATRSACAASSTEMPSWLASPRSSSMRSSSFGSCSDRPDVHGARDLAHLLHEVVGDLHEAARVGAVELDLHRLLRAVVEVVEHHVLGADQPLEPLAQVRWRSRAAERSRSLLLADVDADAAAARRSRGCWWPWSRASCARAPRPSPP